MSLFSKVKKFVKKEKPDKYSPIEEAIGKIVDTSSNNVKLLLPSQSPQSPPPAITNPIVTQQQKPQIAVPAPAKEANTESKKELHKMYFPLMSNMYNYAIDLKVLKEASKSLFDAFSTIAEKTENDIARNQAEELKLFW